MQGIIRQLPMIVANQIAAGEVILRPSSAVKELMENSIDAGATQIKLLVKNSGKSYVQVIDNGSGMNPDDAQMCFLRHATSKLTQAEDLYSLTTKGFRGEALASIAAIAQVELKTKREEDELGTFVRIEHNEVLQIEPCMTENGTSISVKNIFFNIPARRNFLKSDKEELRQIMIEFERLAISHPSIEMSLYHNDHILLQLDKTTYNKRILQIFGAHLAPKIVEFREQTPIMSLMGYVSKPMHSSKSYKSKQFIYVNGRYVKSPLMYRACQSAYHGLIPSDHYLFLVLFVDIQPDLVDINVHPQKYEVKFVDEQMVFKIVEAAIKRSLTAYQLAPSLDFSLDPQFQNLPSVSRPINKRTQGNSLELVNPTSISANRPQLTHHRDNVAQQWQTLFQGNTQEEENSVKQLNLLNEVSYSTEMGKIFIPKQKIILCHPNGKSLQIIDLKNGFERVLFERLYKQSQRISIQQLLFPEPLYLEMQELLVLEEILANIQDIGYILEKKDKEFQILGVPAHIEVESHSEVIQKIIQEFMTIYRAKTDILENYYKSLSRISALYHPYHWSQEEIENFLSQLFSCENPHISPTGKQILTYLTLD